MGFPRHYPRIPCGKSLLMEVSSRCTECVSEEGTLKAEEMRRWRDEGRFEGCHGHLARDLSRAKQQHLMAAAREEWHEDSYWEDPSYVAWSKLLFCFIVIQDDTMCSTIVQPPFAVVVFYDLLFCHGGPHLMFTLRRSWWRLCNIWSNGEPHVAHEKTCPGSPAGRFDNWKLVTNGYINLGYYIIETLGKYSNPSWIYYLADRNEWKSISRYNICFIWTGCNLVHEYVAMIGKYWEYVRTSQGSARQGFHVVAIMILWNGTHKMEKHMEKEQVLHLFSDLYGCKGLMATHNSWARADEFGFTHWVVFKTLGWWL